MPITVRPATPVDKPAILEISSHIWEGDDYVPSVLDGWLAAPDSVVVAAELDGEVVAFAHISWPLPGYAWMEGIRTHPNKENRGAGRAITSYLLDLARQRGTRTAALSTYIENYASLHIVESFGFRRVAAFVLLSAEDELQRRAAQPSSLVVEVPHAEAIEFISASDSLAIAQGYFPHGWQFLPFALAPQQIMDRMQLVLGIRRTDRLSALVCCGYPAHGPGEFDVDFAAGQPDDLALLIRHVLYLAGPRAWFGAMAPAWSGQTATALSVFRSLGFRASYQFAPDIFLYIREP